METHSFEIDEMRPDVVNTPDSSDELQDIVKHAYLNEKSVVAWGFGTRQHIGNKLRSYSSAISMLNLSQIKSFEPRDLTITLEAGANLLEINNMLSDYNLSTWFLPYLGKTTIGGYLASNYFDPYRQQFGSIRESVIGITFIDGTGTKIKSGGQVVKNVQGIDIHRVHTGAFGTLGIITEISLKLAPFNSNQDIIKKADFQSGYDSDFAHFKLSKAEEKILNNGKLLTQMKANFSKSNLLKFLDNLPNINGNISVGASISHGTVLIEINASDLQDCEQTIQSLQNAIYRLNSVPIIERLPLDLKKKFDVFGKKPSSFSLMQNLKKQFDPKGILSPGRFLGGI